jgi:ABC-type nitrate/sulfonate/bicarbonate transport system permease component
LAVPSAPEAASVRVWQIMSRGRGHGRGHCRRRVFMLPILRQAWSAILVACALGLLFYFAVALAEHLAMPWQLRRGKG